MKQSRMVASGVVNFLEAKHIYSKILEAEKSLTLKRDELLMLAFSLGRKLFELKEEIGHGKWLFWLGGNWPELGERNAQRCIALYRDNLYLARSREVKIADSSDLNVDSVRKFMWGYIPAKERLQLDGDEEIKPGAHHLTFVNQFAKWDRQLSNGHIEGFSLEIFQREIEPMLRRLAELCDPDWIASVIKLP